MSDAFSRPPDRTGSHATKWVARSRVFGREDVIPLWVADMDFASPPAVSEALIERARHPVYGYTECPDSLFDALMQWLAQRHRWSGQREHVRLIGGVIPALHAVVQAFSRPGEGVIVMPPVYPPFFDAIRAGDRRLIESPLRLTDGQYRMDFDHLEACASETDNRLLLLCSPHNPIGRIWSEQELDRLLDIARRHGLVVFSDEIHADLVYPDRPAHTLLVNLAGAGDAVITAVAPGKSFNIQGLGLAALLCPCGKLRGTVQGQFDRLPALQCNPFSIAAFEAGYRHGGHWLDALLRYLQGNRDRVTTFLHRHCPEISVIDPQGTFLLWLDCRNLGLEDDALAQFLVQEAGVGMNPGVRFGEQGSGFMRMNIGAPAGIIDRALERISTAIGSGSP